MKIQSMTKCYLVTLVICIAAVALLSGCASTKIRRLSGDRFMKQADEISQINSFHWTSFVGASASRVYLEYGYPAFIGHGVRATVYWTPLSELPEETVQDLKAGHPVWKPRPQERILSEGQ